MTYLISITYVSKNEKVNKKYGNIKRFIFKTFRPFSLHQLN